MNSWLRIRRLRGPAFLILVGLTALLNQWGVLSFGRSWPLYLILAGVFGLAERAALADAPTVPIPYASAAYPAGRYSPAPAYSGPTPPSASSSPEGEGTDPHADPNRRP
jgi:Domain of unknown function (DUF5668)